MKALIIIDYTNDFVADTGKLTCGLPGQRIEQAVVQLAQRFLTNKDYVVLATDLHEEQDTFHPETSLYPPHNIKETSGRDYFGSLADIVKEHPECYDMPKRRYSAFAGTDLAIRLRERNIQEIHLCGVCTDICVLHTAVDAYNLGFRIVVHEQAVASFDEVGHHYALQHLERVIGATIERG